MKAAMASGRPGQAQNRSPHNPDPEWPIKLNRHLAAFERKVCIKEVDGIKRGRCSIGGSTSVTHFRSILRPIAIKAAR